jgi:hypothetical protein
MRITPSPPTPRRSGPALVLGDGVGVLGLDAGAQAFGCSLAEHFD